MENSRRKLPNVTQVMASCGILGLPKLKSYFTKNEQLHFHIVINIFFKHSLQLPLLNKTSLCFGFLVAFLSYPLSVSHKFLTNKYRINMCRHFFLFWPYRSFWYPSESVLLLIKRGNNLKLEISTDFWNYGLFVEMCFSCVVVAFGTHYSFTGPI